MTKMTTKIALFAAAITGASLAGGCNNGGGHNSNSTAHYQSISIPTDVAQTCTVSPAQLNSWFANDTARPNGFVLPANSATFPANASDSNFYKWSEQMFLWITSPVNGGGSIVLENSSFFMVLPDSADGNREMIQCQPGILKTMGHIKNFAGHGRSFVQDRKGKMWRVLDADKNTAAQSTVASDNGTVKVARVEKNAAGGHKFYDEKGGEIAHPRAVIAGKAGASNIAKKVVAGGKTVILSALGEVDADAETAQATGNALIAQNGSVVHYIIFVNDFYAYYATGQKNGIFKGTKIDTLLPTDTIGRNLVCKYARDSFNVTILDSNALAMEIKTSWVEVNDKLLDKDGMITITATVPIFNAVGDTMMAQNPDTTNKVTLALTGMHVLGSAFGHPEMIWATFEHQSNAPNASYVYATTANTSVVHPADACGGKWLLHDSTCLNENLNGLIATRTNGLDTFQISRPLTIGPRNVRRQAPWGNFDPSPSNANSVAQNTMVMSLNNSVRSQLAALGNDVRTKYMFIGALWTAGGVVPNPAGIDSFQAPIDTINARGGIQLANSTMETYMSLLNTDAGCFDCHNSSLNPATAFDLSHIFSQLNPLPKAPQSMKK